MNTITEIFRAYSPAYLNRFGETMPENHRKTIDAIVHCRTDAYGVAIFECVDCAERHLVYCSCGNRHCPSCQHHKAKQWLQKQLDNQLPGNHFLITFTAPEQARAFIRGNQKVAYDAMFKASSEALKLLAADDKFIGGDLPGFFGVLHTWGRTLQYHPHIHYVVVGGAISKKDGAWHPSGSAFYVPVKALSKIYRAKFRDELQKAGLLGKLPPETLEMDWNVNIQAVGASEQTIGYLAPYVFKVAISNSRIEKVENGQVVFRYKKQKSARWRRMTLDVFEFMRRFLQHVLPSGFMKIRYYGFLHPSCSFSKGKITEMINSNLNIPVRRTTREKATPPPPPECRCPSCGGKMNYLGSLLPHGVSIGFNSG